MNKPLYSEELQTAEWVAQGTPVQSTGTPEWVIWALLIGALLLFLGVLLSLSRPSKGRQRGGSSNSDDTGMFFLYLGHDHHDHDCGSDGGSDDCDGGCD